jgi:hypothetical protein
MTKDEIVQYWLDSSNQDYPVMESCFTMDITFGRYF